MILRNDRDIKEYEIIRVFPIQFRTEKVLCIPADINPRHKRPMLREVIVQTIAQFHGHTSLTLSPLTVNQQTACHIDVVLPFPVLGVTCYCYQQQQRRNNNLFHTKVHINSFQLIDTSHYCCKQPSFLPPTASYTFSELISSYYYAFLNLYAVKLQKIQNPARISNLLPYFNIICVMKSLYIDSNWEAFCCNTPTPNCKTNKHDK